MMGCCPASTWLHERGLHMVTIGVRTSSFTWALLAVRFNHDAHLLECQV